MNFAPISADQPPLSDQPGHTAEFGRLVISAVPAFYDLVPLAEAELATAVGGAIGRPGGELENAAGAWVDDQPAAIVCWLDLDRLAAAQRASSIELMRQVDRAEAAGFLRTLAAFSGGVEPIDGQGLYLSRIAVAKPAQGRGLGRDGVQVVLDAADGADVWLHVAADNEPAIGLYRELGFQFTSNASFASRVMRRTG